MHTVHAQEGDELNPIRLRRRARGTSGGFTLIELLVVIAIIGLLVSILVPSLGAARQQARAAQCLTQLRVLGQGLVIYLNENNDVLPPSRLPKRPGYDCDPVAIIYGRPKYRPTFVASMSASVGMPPFDDPQACKSSVDMFGEPGDRQNYASRLYVCPVVSDWTDERNGSYGYNYQFLGNSRLFDDSDPNSFKNWPVVMSRVKQPGRTVMAGDCMGTAAQWAAEARLPYDNNGRELYALGDEGFNLDPPWVDVANGGEIADDSGPARSAADPRHRGKANILWLDGHVVAQTLQGLGYEVNADGSVGHFGENVLWTGSGVNEPWLPGWQP